MYVRLKTSKQSRNSTLQIVESFREGKKVRQRVVASLGIVNDAKNMKRLARLAEGLIHKLQEEGAPIPAKVDLSKLLHTQTVYDGFGVVVDKLMSLSGFSHLLKTAQGKHQFNLEEVVKLIITQRLDLPSSKLRTFERQTEHGFDGIELQHLYRTMDAIFPLDDQIQAQAFKFTRMSANYPVDCFFFDVTTLYFESVVQDELKDFGYSKDQKYHTVQVVLALVVDREGVPLAYQTFKGNLAETKTLIPVMESLRSQFSVENVTVVCDRGLASEPNIEALQASGFHFVIASKLRSFSKKHMINDLNDFKPLPHQENTPHEDQVLFKTLEHPKYKDTLLIATYSPNRAKKDRYDREKLVEKLKAKLTDHPDETSVKKVISNGGYKKYTITKEGSLLSLNQAAIDADAAWDGFHGIAVSNSAKLSVTEALARYKELWHVEESFRITKSTLRARPIFHWAPERIKAHVLLCFMTLFLERTLELLLKRKGAPLSPDKIRYALSQVHSMHFKEAEAEKECVMRSSLSEDARKIFRALGVELT